MVNFNLNNPAPPTLISFLKLDFYSLVLWLYRLLFIGLPTINKRTRFFSNKVFKWHIYWLRKTIKLRKTKNWRRKGKEFRSAFRLLSQNSVQPFVSEVKILFSRSSLKSHHLRVTLYLSSMWNTNGI